MGLHEKEVEATREGKVGRGRGYKVGVVGTGM